MNVDAIDRVRRCRALADRLRSVEPHRPIVRGEDERPRCSRVRRAHRTRGSARSRRLDPFGRRQRLGRSHRRVVIRCTLPVCSGRGDCSPGPANDSGPGRSQVRVLRRSIVTSRGADARRWVLAQTVAVSPGSKQDGSVRHAADGEPVTSRITTRMTTRVRNFCGPSAGAAIRGTTRRDYPTRLDRSRRRPTVVPSESRSADRNRARGADDRADRDVRSRENGATRERDEARVTYTDEDSPARAQPTRRHRVAQKKLRERRRATPAKRPARRPNRSAVGITARLSSFGVTVARHRIAAFRPATRSDAFMARGATFLSRALVTHRDRRR